MHMAATVMKVKHLVFFSLRQQSVGKQFKSGFCSMSLDHSCPWKEKEISWTYQSCRSLDYCFGLVKSTRWI